MPEHDDLEKKTKGAVRYRPKSAQGREQCGNCLMYQSRGTQVGSCSLVMGVIEAQYVCDRWEPKR